MPGIASRFGGEQVGDALGAVRDGLGRVAIRADLERVLALDLEQVADLGEDAGDGEVVHERAQAVTRVSTRRPSRFDAEIEEPAAMRGDRLADGGDAVGLAEAEQAAAAAGAADLAAERAGAARRGEHRVDLRRRDAGRQALAVLPLVGDLPADLGPVAALERRRASLPAMSRMRAKRCCTSRSPSMWRLVTSQLLMPELREAPV